MGHRKEEEKEGGQVPSGTTSGKGDFLDTGQPHCMPRWIGGYAQPGFPG